MVLPTNRFVSFVIFGEWQLTSVKRLVGAITKWEMHTWVTAFYSISLMHKLAILDVDIIQTGYFQSILSGMAHLNFSFAWSSSCQDNSFSSADLQAFQDLY